MKALLGKMVKGALVFAAVGALLALAAPAIGSLVGLAEVGAAANIGWQAAFFGAFGAIVPLAEKAVGALFGSEEKPAEPHILISIKHEQAQAPAIEHEHGVDTKHVERLQAQRDEMMRNTTLGTSASI